MQGVEKIGRRKAWRMTDRWPNYLSSLGVKSLGHLDQKPILFGLWRLPEIPCILGMHIFHILS